MTSFHEPVIPVSVILAARNEKNNINNIISSIHGQNYPDYEVIIVDDYSDDGTYDLLERSVSGYKLIKNKMKPGKKYALASGINNSANEIIMVTDADCLPERNWITSFMRKFSERTGHGSANRATIGYDLLFGAAPFLDGKKLVNKLSSFENLRGFMLSVAALGLKVPYSAAARSMAFRKSSFERIGGYSNTMEIPFGDDGLLIREAVKNKLKIGFVHGEGSLVYTKSKSNWKDYFRQRKRHTTTSFYYSSRTKLLLAVWHLVNLFPLFLFFFTPFNFYFSIPLLTKLFFDSVSVLVLQKKFGYKFRFHQVIFYQVLYEFVLVIHFINALKGWTCGRVDVWK